MTAITAVLMAGIVFGHLFSFFWVWLLASCVAAIGVAWMLGRRSERGVQTWATLCLLCLAAAWLILRSDYMFDHNLTAYIGETSQLARVQGELIEPPVSGSPKRGAFAPFSYEAPSTRIVLRVNRIEVDGAWTQALGDLLMRVDQADDQLTPGQHIEATGWLSAIAGPQNLGEFDYRAYLAERGIVGRITLRSRGNWKPLPDTSPSLGTAQRSIRQFCADRALHSLRIGMDDDTPTLGLLETMLLGRKDSSSSEVRVAFRQVGLAHMLSISGAHLAILLGIVTLITRWFVPHPPRVAMIVLVVLALYLMAVPLRVPIVRSAIMAGVFCAAYATGRQVRPIQALAFAAAVVLLWRPMDLFSPGFQLSFAAVAGLILFVPSVSEWLWPKPDVLPGHLSISWVIGRWCVDYLAVSIVAFAVVMPLVAFHFQMVNPLAVLLSIMALPVITAVLGVGYLKILIGIILPSAGLILAGPLDWLGDTLRNLVDHAADWPAAAIFLNWQPSITWTFALATLILAVFAGAFKQRRKTLAAACLIIIAWTGLTQFTPRNSWLGKPQPQPPAAILTMFAVGDGSCYLVQLPDHTIMFDCGSQQYFDIAQASILPALKQMGVSRIDTLILSHADMDHYGGALDLADNINIGRVFIPPQLLEEAKAHPGTATSFLIDGLTDRGLFPKTVCRDWTESLNDSNKTNLQILWPPEDFNPKRTNDTSILLAIQTAGRRILLNGDIADEAMTNLMQLENLNADITDLPHHGSIVDASPAWLHAVNPSIVLQSSGRTRLYQDAWPDIIKDIPLTRLITAKHGMTQVRVNVDGTIESWTLRQNHQPQINANQRE